MSAGGRVRTEVVIVGLGPVGAAAANLAGAAGLDTLVIDRDVTPFALPRAIVFDAEIMRVFASVGLDTAIGAITKPLGGSVYLGADLQPIRVFRSPGPAHATAFSPSNLFYQPQLETVLRDGLTRFPNVRVLTGCELTEVESSEASAQLRVRDRDGAETRIEARFVLACDGASSTVRKRLGVALDDIGFEERWLVVDAHMRGPMRWPEARYAIPDEVREGRFSLMVCDPEQPATLIPGRGDHRRWEYMLKPTETDEEAQSAESLRARIGVWADPDDVEVVRSAVYRFRALVAHRWRKGAVFLLGDAAHQTPPFFGQGMCHGVRDAAQLVWRLRLVTEGRASPDLLSTYQTEREPHVRSIISASVAAGAAVCITDPERARARDVEFRALEAARAGKPVAMTDVVPPIREGLIDAATGGARLPEFAMLDEAGRPTSLDRRLDGRFALVTGDAGPTEDVLPPGLRGRWTALGGHTVRLPAAADVDGRFARWLDTRDAACVLVRPDRYLFGAARDATQLADRVHQLADETGAPSPALEIVR